MHFRLVFPFLILFYDHVSLFHVYVYFCQTLRYTCIPLESFAFHANLYYGLKLCLGTCVDKSYIYLEMKCCFNENLVFHVFMCLCLNFMYMSILSKLFLYIYILFEPRAFMHISIVDSLCLDMYVYFSLYRTYIYLED